MRHRFPIILAFCASLVIVAAVPASAQRRHHSRGRITVIRHSPLLWGGGFGFYRSFYHPYYLGYAQWYPHPGFGFPLPGFYAHDPVVTVRLQVNPREAQVYVDGYAAGVVDDFDGVFQRLRLVPGPHEIVVYHPGYRTLRQSAYFNPGSTHTIRHTLDALAPGETQEPQPLPRPMPQGAVPPIAGTAPSASQRLGSLSLRVQPADATVLVDGEPWKGPPSQDRLVIQLAEGPHRVRVEKPGFQPFSVDVDVRAGETASFNVSLLSQ